MKGVGSLKCSDYTTNDQYIGDVTGLADGGYVIAWHGRGADQTNNDGVYLRQYNSAGEMVKETVVSDTVASEQTNIKVTHLADGGVCCKLVV